MLPPGGANLLTWVLWDPRGAAGVAGCSLGSTLAGSCGWHPPRPVGLLRLARPHYTLSAAVGVHWEPPDPKPAPQKGPEPPPQVLWALSFLDPKMSWIWSLRTLLHPGSLPFPPIQPHST